MDTANYFRLRQKIIFGSFLSLRSVSKADMESIRIWRNDQIAVLRQDAPISKVRQKRYYKQEVLKDKRSPNPKNILLAIDYESTLIGYGGLVHLNWENRSGEVSFLLNPELMSDEKRYDSVFLEYVELIKRVAFQDLELHRISSETYSFRVHHIKLIESAGFEREGVLKDKVFENGEFYDSVLHAIVNTDL